MYCLIEINFNLCISCSSQAINSITTLPSASTSCLCAFLTINNFSGTFNRKSNCVKSAQIILRSTKWIYCVKPLNFSVFNLPLTALADLKRKKKVKSILTYTKSAMLHKFPNPYLFKLLMCAPVRTLCSSPSLPCQYDASFMGFVNKPTPYRLCRRLFYQLNNKKE